MNKEKLKHLPFNFFWCASSFILPFVILTEIAQMNTLASIGIAFYIYFLDIKGQTDTDYLSEKINKLEDAEKQLLIKRVSNALDLVELQGKIDEALDSETSESLKEWLHSKRL